MKKPKVQINYKSGHSIVVTVDKITVKRNTVDGSISAQWVNMSPNPLLLGPDDIESIWDMP